MDIAFSVDSEGQIYMMVKIDEFIHAAQGIPVLDVRSPAEYQKGHIPGAISFPLFTNNERVEIGTMYKQIGRQPAFERGLELVGPKIKDMVVQAQEYALDGKLLVHCWRGGMRSASVGQLLGMSGLDVQVLKGGYKSFRNWALDQLKKDYDFHMIGGMTGSNKTGILFELGAKGAAFVDLEGLADHKGSTFGALDSGPKVTQAQFENDLAWQLYQQSGKSIWLEDESRKIGTITIPVHIWDQMREAPFFYLDVPKEKRVKHLVEGYGAHEEAELMAAIHRISTRLGGLRTQQALQMLEEGKADELAALLLGYYDKAYSNAMKTRRSKKRVSLPVDNEGPGEIADQLLVAAKELLAPET